MDEDAFNMSVRKYLKKLGVTAQREIEAGVRERIDAGGLQGDESLPVEATITIEGLAEPVIVKGAISLA